MIELDYVWVITSSMCFRKKSHVVVGDERGALGKNGGGGSRCPGGDRDREGMQIIIRGTVTISFRQGVCCCCLSVLFLNSVLPSENERKRERKEREREAPKEVYLF